MFCFCLAALRTYPRFVQLCNKPNTPIAVYKKNPKSRNCSWMVNRGIESKLRLAVWNVFYPKEKLMTGSLAKITLHSICIQAAMLLFEANALDIKVIGRLRYKSIVFQNVLLQHPCTCTAPHKSNEILRQLPLCTSSHDQR